jgi:ubiquitin carboxyl-terminal hydrolase 40
MVTSDGPAVRVSPEPIDSIVISKLSTLLNLKEQIASLNSFCGFDIPTPQFLRVRPLTSSLQPGAILRQHAVTLQKLKLVNGGALGAELLHNDEDLGINQMLLVVRRRLPAQRRYSDCAIEVVWDVSQGAHFASLAHTIAEAVGELVEAVHIAKHLPERGEWMILSEMVGGGPSKGKRRKKKRGPQSRTAAAGSTPCDLRHAPYHLQDGDVIGVKVAGDDGDIDDFGTPEDDCIRHEIEQRRHDADAHREQLKHGGSARADKRMNQNNRPEVAIKIHVDDFR